MPELPEVETTRRGIRSALRGRRVSEFVLRNHKLRWPVDHGLAKVLPGQHVRDVSRTGPVHDGAFLLDGGVFLATGGSEVRVADRAAFPLPGEHNTENLLLALAACQAMGAKAEALGEGLRTYRGLPHRIGGRGGVVIPTRTGGLVGGIVVIQVELAMQPENG